MSASKSGGLRDPLEEANRHDVLRAMRGCRAHGQPGPDDHHGGEEDPGFDIPQREIRWDLATFGIFSLLTLPLTEHNAAHMV